MQADLKVKRTPIVKKFEDYQPFPKKRIQYNINRKQRKSRNRKIYRLSHNAQFSTEEDERILRLVNDMGPKFVKIATFFPNKSYSMVKNRYYKHLRDQIKEQPTPKQENTPQNEKLEELNQLIQTINFSPEISSITKSFIGGLIKCLI